MSYVSSARTAVSKEWMRIASVGENLKGGRESENKTIIKRLRLVENPKTGREFKNLTIIKRVDENPEGERKYKG